jgi:glutathione S-transferase
MPDQVRHDVQIDVGYQWDNTWFVNWRRIIVLLRFLPHSPFVRKTLVVAHEKGLADQIDIADAHVFDPDDPVHQDNPMGKVPALVRDDGSVLYDSNVICEYFDNLVPEPQLTPSNGEARLTALRRNALGDGLSQAATWGMRERIRPEGERSDTYIGYFDRTMSKCLAAANNEALDFPDQPTLGEISIACALSYIDLRYPDMDWRDNYTQLASWYEEFCKRPSMMATPLRSYDGPRNPPG